MARKRNPIHFWEILVGRYQSGKWSKLAKTSHDTALRDIQKLIEKRILKQEKGSGRSTSYVLVRERSA